MPRPDWPSHIVALNDSELSARAYARQHDLVYSQLIYWKRKLAKAADASAPSVDGFVAVTLGSHLPAVDCLGTLEFPTGVRLHIHSPQLLPGLLPYLGVSALP